MEAFESFVALALEEEGLVVSPAVKFPVERRTARIANEERQVHGYEVDLVGARSDLLALANRQVALRFPRGHGRRRHR